MPGKRKTSPRRKKSPKRKTSQKRVKRKTSPKRIKRKTSPRRKRRMNGIGDYFRRRTGREVGSDDPGLVDIDWPEEMEAGPGRPRRQDSAGPGRPRRQDSAGPGRPRAGEYSNLSEDRLGITLLTVLESIETCEDLMSLQQTSSEMRQFIMNNLPVIYRGLKKKDPMLPDLVFTDDIKKNYKLFKNSCLDRERQAALKTNLGSMEWHFAQLGHDKYYAYKKYLKQLIDGGFNPEDSEQLREARIIASDIVDGIYEERIIDTAIALHNLGFDMLSFRLLGKLPDGYLTSDQIKILELLMSDRRFSGYHKRAILQIVSEEPGSSLINHYTSGRFTERQTVNALYASEIRLNEFGY